MAGQNVVSVVSQNDRGKEKERSSRVRSSRASRRTDDSGWTDDSRRTEILRALRLFDFWIFFRLSFFYFSFLFDAVIDLLLGLLVVKKLLRTRHRDTIFTMEKPPLVAGNFAGSFSLNFWSIFVHISGTIRPITLIWVLLEGSFPRASVEYRWRQFWSKLMTSEVPGYGRQRSRRVKVSYVTYASGKSSFVNLS